MLDYVLCDDLSPYLLTLNNTNDIRPIISLNQIGQSLITKRHGLFTKFQDIIEEWFLFSSHVLREDLGSNSTKVETSSNNASSKVPSSYNFKFAYVQEDEDKKEEISSKKQGCNSVDIQVWCAITIRKPIEIIKDISKNQNFE